VRPGQKKVPVATKWDNLDHITKVFNSYYIIYKKITINLHAQLNNIIYYNRLLHLLTYLLPIPGYSLVLYYPTYNISSPEATNPLTNKYRNTLNVLISYKPGRKVQAMDSNALTL
jgi:hypothetical protein